MLLIKNRLYEPRLFSSLEKCSSDLDFYVKYKTKETGFILAMNQSIKLKYKRIAKFFLVNGEKLLKEYRQYCENKITELKFDHGMLEIFFSEYAFAAFFECGEYDIAKTYGQYECKHVRYIVSWDVIGREGHMNCIDMIKKQDLLDEDLFGCACEVGNIAIMNYIMGKYTMPCWINSGLRGACRGDQKILMKFFLKQGGSVEQGLEGAVAAGNRELLDYFISKGATNWRSGFWEAGISRNKEIMDFFISKYSSNWHLPLQEAIKIGDLDMVKHLVSRHNYRGWTMEGSIMWAYKCHYPKIAEYLISKLN